jgi:hypothetical protein
MSVAFSLGLSLVVTDFATQHYQNWQSTILGHLQLQSTAIFAMRVAYT